MMSPFEKLCGKIHAIYRPYRSTPFIERYDIELSTFETRLSCQDFLYCTAMTCVLLFLVIACMFLVNLLIKLLASLTLQKENGKKLHLCIIGRAVPLVWLLKGRFCL